MPGRVHHGLEGWEPRYEPSIDGLRAVAILGVLLAHAGVPFVHGGDEGVTLFFVISGFLITGLLLAEWARCGTVSLRSFYRRRFARLMPVFLLCMAVTTAVLLALGYGLGDFWPGLLSSLTYTSNFIYAAEAVEPGSLNDRYFRHTFSLAIEEQFYFAWPCVLLLLLRRPGGLRYLLLLTAVLAVAPFFWRYLLERGDASFWRIKHGTDTRVDALMLGCFLALAMAAGWMDRWARHASVLAWVSAAGVVVVLLRGHLLPKDQGAYLSAALAAGGLVTGVVLDRGCRVAKLLGNRVLNYIGRRSYSLYLWNVLLLALWYRSTDLPPAQTIWGVLWIAGVFLVAELSYRFVERPLRARLRGRRPHGDPAPPFIQAQVQNP